MFCSHNIMKYIYGPVRSRRLGLSLGISVTPYKVCDFDCIYCQLGKTKQPTGQRQEYIQKDKIIDELKLWLQNNADTAKNLDYITIAGSGEPILNIKIRQVIEDIKKLTATPVAVITNASLLGDRLVRNDLLAADLIVPSLDSVIPEIFQRINRPLADIKIEEIIKGLISLRKEFSGKIWLEIMIVRGVNDRLSQIRKLKDIVEMINPDKIQINSPVRSTAEKNVFPAGNKKLEKFKEILGQKCQII